MTEVEVCGKILNMKFGLFNDYDFKGFSFKKFFYRLYQKSFDDDIFSSAAQVAFYFTFAMFPLLLFLLSVIGIVLESADQLRAELFDYLRQIMPSSAFDLVSKTIEEVVVSSSGGKLTIGLLITLYSASAGLDSARIALNGVYNLKETRPFWKTKLLSVLLTLGVGILVAIALGTLFYGSQFIGVILGSLGLPTPSPSFLKILAWVIIPILLILTFALIYNFCPNHSPFKWKWITPGAISAIVLWVLFSLAFRLYLSYFDSFAKTYGSLGAVIILLLWLYLTALVILIGGAINAIFDEFSGIKKSAKDEAKEQKQKARAEGKPSAESEDKETGASKEKSDQNESPDKTLVKFDGGDGKSIGDSASDIKPAKKSKLNFIVGAVFASLVGIFSSKRKR